MNARMMVMLIAAWCFTTSTIAAVLVPRDAEWKYFKGRSEASNPADAWRQPSFDDTGWAMGAGPLYYDNNGVYTGNTALPDMRTGYTSVFMRHAFTVEDPETALALDLKSLSDDGFIAWINGVEVARYNVPAGHIAASGTASSAAAEPLQMRTIALPDPATYLVAGKNVLAVHAFNVSLTSSDFVCDLQLESIEPDLIPPTISSVSPEPGFLSELTQVRVVFSEPVSGVHSGDLMMNDISAVGLTGTGAEYTFSFPPLPLGEVLARWTVDHGISDLGRPPNAFDGFEPGATWKYVIQDQAPPVIASMHPMAEETVRNLEQLEISFSEPVTGVEASDLLINGTEAISVSGSGSGPYRFVFNKPVSGPVQFQWAAGHGITDLADPANAYAGQSWNVVLDPDLLLDDVVINEVMAINLSGLRDENFENPDWIELYNRGDRSVDLRGWSLTDDRDQPGKWIFPATTLGPKEYLVVFASGKNRSSTVGARLHTNFKLSGDGEYLGLYNAEAPRAVISELAPEYPEQRGDHSYGRNPEGQWRYYSEPTPGRANGISTILGILEPPHFSVQRGFFNFRFGVHLSTEIEGAQIRYTLDWSEPTSNTGYIYGGSAIVAGRGAMVIRAATFKKDYLPSRVVTHSYLINASDAVRTLPALSIVTPRENLWGETGIMEVSPRNTTKRGIAWERPVSVEFIRPEDHGGFQLDAGLRIQGGNYVRERYDPSASLPFRKYSFRLYFRGDYGASKLEYPLFPESPITSYDKVVLRAGMNDHTNPFIVDELARRLSADMGHVASHGTFVSLFLNGAYKGYYNPTERIDSDFLRSWHGGTNDWDIIAQFGEVREGDTARWNELLNIVRRDQTSSANYSESERRLDMVNFVDYLLLNIYAGTGDWPHNNWRAARERVANAKFRFYVWDAEWAFGNLGRSVSVNVITEELTRSAPITDLFQSLRRNPEFKLLFADRVQKHLFNSGALSEQNVRKRFEELRETMKGVLPQMNTSILTTWIPRRPAIIMNHMRTAGLLASEPAPSLNQHGGRVPAGFQLTMTSPSGKILYTLDGTDPRTRYSGAISPGAIEYTTPVTLEQNTIVKARVLNGTTWSALTEASFEVGIVGLPLRITEIMYHPAAGDMYEFLELENMGGSSLDLSGFSFSGIDYAFPANTTLNPGATLLLVSNDDPSAFLARYPTAAIHGVFAGNLSNGGERIAILDLEDRVIWSVVYDDENGWPTLADGGGASLELKDWRSDPNVPSNWQPSALSGGSPSAPNPVPNPSPIQLSEVMTDNASGVSLANSLFYGDWIELHNSGAEPVSLAGWSLGHSNGPERFVFPAGIAIGAGDYLVVWCTEDPSVQGLRAPFDLHNGGESIFLYNSQGTQVSGLSFGAQLPDYTLGQVDGSWQLTLPTPEEANEKAQVAPETSIVINEWLANPAPGAGSDWVELFNRDGAQPVALTGLSIETQSGLFPVRPHTFIPPSGYLVLAADKSTQSGHLDFKLPAEGDEIALYSSAGVLLNRIVYGSQLEGFSSGRLPDGGISIAKFPRGGSPGSANVLPSYSGPLLNEFMARNVSAVLDTRGQSPDWLELFNPLSTAFDLSGMSISIGSFSPGEWQFPTGTLMPAQSYLLIWADGSRKASFDSANGFNIGKSLDGQAGEIFLFRADGLLADSIEYGFQIENQSVGKSSGQWKLLARPTPGSPNSIAASLAPPNGVRINEWMADPSNGDDWFELYNTNSLPVQLTGLFLADNPSVLGQTNSPVGPLTFIAGNGWVKWIADGQSGQGLNHVNFSLDRQGEFIRLYTTGVFSLIDSVDFGLQQRDVARGRLPDGQFQIAELPGSASPGGANYLALPDIVINEVLVHPKAPLDEAIELANISDEAVDISGWFLSDSHTQLAKFRIPDGTIVPAGGYVVFYGDQLRSSDTTRSLVLNSARGTTVHLSRADSAGNLTGHRTFVQFGPVPIDTSVGRHITGTGIHFVPLSRPTFGVDAPGSVIEFRTGTGKANGPPLVPPVVISEIMYHPASAQSNGTAEASAHEYIEIHNPSESIQPLRGWRVAGGINYEFPEDAALGAGALALLVSFEPADSMATAAFKEQYGVPATVQLFGPFSGRLNNSGESVALQLAGQAAPAGQPDAGLVPLITLEQITYSDAPPWPMQADGDGYSLQRKQALSFGNDPANWDAALPNPGRVNNTIGTDQDNDGVPDEWEDLHGLNAADPNDAFTDPDGDGMSNLAEYLSGTDPTDSESFLGFDSVSLDDGQVVLRFGAVAGRSYSVFWTESLGNGVWIKLADVPALPEPGIHEVSDETTSGQRYYRLTTP